MIHSIYIILPGLILLNQTLPISNAQFTYNSKQEQKIDSISNNDTSILDFFPIPFGDIYFDECIPPINNLLNMKEWEKFSECLNIGMYSGIGEAMTLSSYEFDTVTVSAYYITPNL